MTSPVSHSHSGDRVLITVEFPSEALTLLPTSEPPCPNAGNFAVTLDSEDWHDMAKRVLREESRADREDDPEVTAARVEFSLRRAVAREMAADQDPEVMRRRSVLGVLHRLGDMVMGGTVKAFEVVWRDQAIEASYTIGREGRARHRVIQIRLTLPEAP